ncbi:MAG: hypothetical protein DRG33_03215, partial [Deltaproteobacteria bacterium]
NNSRGNVFIDIFNRAEVNSDAEITNLQIENPHAQINKFAIGCVDSAVFIAPGGAERVISISNDFKMKKLGIEVSAICDYMKTKENTDGYRVNEFDTGVYLLDSPAPLFAKDSVEYRDGDYVGLWLSFGTLLKYDLRDLNVFNIDGVKVGGIDSDISSKSVKILKMLTNTAYGYASIIFNKKNLLRHLMSFSKRYIYESNLQEESRVCVDNILFNLTNTGILGLVYDEFEAVEEFPMFAFDETTVSVVKSKGTVLKFKYQDDYIYMMLDLEAEKMYFMSYHGKIHDYYNSRFNYNIKVMNNLWVSKVSDIGAENFVLFTGFPNLEHNKVLDLYFDNTAESFSSLDKQFAVDVTEFDAFYLDAVENPASSSHDARTDFMHVYGNNPIPLVTGLLSYKELSPASIREQARYELCTNASPDIKTFIDAKERCIYMFEPVVNANGEVLESVPELKVRDFIGNYVSRWQQGDDVKEWITEAEYGGYVWDLMLKYFSNGWTFYKHSEGTYRCVKLPTVRRLSLYSGSIVTHSLMEAEAIIEDAILTGRTSMLELNAEAMKRAKYIEQNYALEIKQTAMAFMMQIFTKMTLDTNIIDPDSPFFDFKKHLGSEDIYINGAPDGPFSNHAIIYDDTFQTIVNNIPEVYDSMMSYTSEAESFYCPYISDFRLSKTDDIIEVLVSSDIASSRSIFRNTRSGISMYKPDSNRSGSVTVGGLSVPEEEAYDTYLALSYLGIRKIKEVDFHIVRIVSKMKFSEEFIAALAPTMTSERAFDWREYPTAESQFQKETEGSSVALNLDLESGQPMYIAFIGSKLMVSLDGSNFLDAPIGGSSVELSSSLLIEDRTSFMKTLNTLLYQRKNGLSIALRETGLKVDNDIYNIGVVSINIDTEALFESGEVTVHALFVVDNGQVVLADSNFIYNEGETFSVSKTIDVSGFKRTVPDIGDFGTLKTMIPFFLEYHSLVPTKNETIFDTAGELLLHDTAYKIRMNLPMFISMPANEFYYLDRDEAAEDGVSLWVNFKGEE